MKGLLRRATGLVAVAAVLGMTSCSSGGGGATEPSRSPSVPENAFAAGPTDTWSDAGFKVDPTKLACGGAAQNPTRGITDTSVKVGGLAFLTSPNGSSLAGADVGAKLRFQRADDEGGVNGRKIDFVGVRDDGQDPTRNAQLAKSLVQQDQVFAVAPLMTLNTGYLDTLCKNVVPFFGWTTNTGYCGNLIGFSIIGCGTPSEAVSKQVGTPGIGLLMRNLFKGETGRTLALVGFDTEVSQVSVRNFAKQATLAGYKVVYNKTPIPVSGLTDSTAVVNAITTSDGGKAPDAIVDLTDVATTVKLTQALRASGYKGKLLEPAAYDPRLKAISELDDTNVILSWAPAESTSPAMTRLKADFAKYAPGQLLTVPAMAGYWSADMFVNALQKAGRKLTVDSFLKTLNSGSYTYGVDDALAATKWPLNHVIQNPCTAMVTFTNKQYVETQKLACGSLIRP